MAVFFVCVCFVLPCSSVHNPAMEYAPRNRRTWKKLSVEVTFNKIDTCQLKFEPDEVPVDLVLQARAQMCCNKVNGPEDAVVSEMIKQLPLEKVYVSTKCFQERFLGQMEAPRSWKIVKLVCLRKPDAAPTKGI